MKVLGSCPVLILWLMLEFPNTLASCTDPGHLHSTSVQAHMPGPSQTLSQTLKLIFAFFQCSLVSVSTLVPVSY